MTLDQVRRTLAEHKHPLFDRDTVEGLVAEIDRLEAQAPALADAMEALRLYDIYDRMPSDRGGKDGPRGRAYQAFVAAKDAALSGAESKVVAEERE